MADSALLRRLHESFPFLSAAPPALGERLVASAEWRGRIEVLDPAGLRQAATAV